MDNFKLFLKEWWGVGALLVTVTVVALNLQTGMQAHAEVLIKHDAKIQQHISILRTICRRLSFTDSQRAECNLREDD